MSPILRGLHAIRESKFMTQRELADRAGVSEVPISRLELGKAAARLTTTRKVAQALGLEPRESVGEG